MTLADIYFLLNPSQSYRIRTPPSSLTACWEKNTMELDPRSDSSDQNDILVSWIFIC